MGNNLVLCIYSKIIISKIENCIKNVRKLHEKRSGWFGHVMGKDGWHLKLQAIELIVEENIQEVNQS